ncbi:hypothetical protein ACH42_05245 [Endozoicomonas sp. (ex Bugula neritina AB1)]|nr:hypothetical protein ACH42_05245 [Endozoicomonas sp. (ex Bugula neritina AB1)]
MSAQDQDEPIRRKEAAQILGVSLATFDRMVKNGIVPAPFKLHPKSRIPLWMRSSIYEWRKQKMTGSD